MTGRSKGMPPFRREVKRIQPYRVANPIHTIKLNQNESPVELPAGLKKKIVSKLGVSEWSRYPDYPAAALTARIAHAVGVKENQVLVGHGSNELLYALALTTLERGKSILMPAPSYAVAKLAAILAGAKVSTFPLGRDFRFDPAVILEAIRRHRPRLLFLPSPNNPTGSSLQADGIARIVGATRSLVVVDEAYHEFSNINLLPLLRRFRNLVLLRTLSKAYRLAALRIGYLLGEKGVLSMVERGKPPHSIDLFSQIAGEALFDEEGLINREVDRVIRERRKMEKELAAMPGITPFPSDSNFLLVKVPDEEALYSHLLRRGILVRRLGAPSGRLKNCLRITIGRKSENRALREAIGEMVSR